MDEVTLYSTGCPKCKVLVSKLQNAEISYNTVTDTQLMLNKGFVLLPMLEVNSEIMDFTQAVEWINNKKDNNR